MLLNECFAQHEVFNLEKLKIGQKENITENLSISFSNVFYENTKQ